MRRRERAPYDTFRNVTSVRTHRTGHIQPGKTGDVWVPVGAQQWVRSAAPTALQVIVARIPSAPALG